MKNLTQKIVGIFILTGFIFCGTALASNSVVHELEIDEVSIVKEDLIGGWEFTVEGAPEGYEKGFMMIVKQSGVYKVQIQLSGGVVNGENVEVSGNNITFNVNVEGEVVKVALTANGSKLSGTSTSPTSGAMNVTGIKSISPQ